jgi:hypothetical protein
MDCFARARNDVGGAGVFRNGHGTLSGQTAALQGRGKQKFFARFFSKKRSFLQAPALLSLVIALATAGGP